MKILLLNDAYFLTSLRSLGHDVFWVSVSPGADLQCDPDPVAVPGLMKACPFKPDFVLLSDSINLRPAFTGWENLECPAVFYGVDAPMNAFWQFDYSRVFDLTFLDQLDSVRRLQELRRDPEKAVFWLPLGADHRLYHRLPLDKQYDLAFVGSLHSRLRPKRTWLLAELKRQFNLQVFDGDNRRALTPAQVVEIYNQSRLVLNENLFPGLNLRLLEAMSCGACTVTEEGEGSWRPFFRDGVHLAAVNSRNLVEKIDSLLKTDSIRQSIADAGMKLVRSRHTIDQRTKILLRETSKLLRRGARSVSREVCTFYQGKASLALATRWPDQPVGKLAESAKNLLLQEASCGRETADLHFELGVCALQEGHPQDATGSLQRAVQLDPAHLRSTWALFWSFREVGEHRQAATELNRLCRHLRMKINMRWMEKIRARSDFDAADYLLFGKILEKAGWLHEPGVDRMAGHPSRWNAWDAWQKAVQMNPTQAESLNKCAEVMEHGSAPEFALPFLEKLVDLQPLNPDYRFRLAVQLLNHYRRQEGLRHLLQFLFTSDDSRWWDCVESLKLSEPEWQFLLDAVLDYSRKAEKV